MNEQLDRRAFLQQSSLLGLALAAGSGRAADASQAKPGERKGPLADLPSQPASHIEKIKALGDNEWLNLGPPAADPKWGKGRGRSWSSKMTYAPDLQGAFLVGQGVHGFIKPDGRYDDIFFYDLNAHQWICIYPGIDTKTFVEDIKKGEFKLNDDGQFVDKNGQPVMYAYGGHSYMTHTYDTDLRKYVMTSAQAGSGLGGDQYSLQMAWDKEGKALLKEQSQGKADRVAGTPFYYDTRSGTFERYANDSLNPRGNRSFANLFYLPTRKVLWQYARGETLLCDCATHKWSNPSAKGPTPPGIDFGAVYDSKRDRVCLFGGNYRPPYAKDEGKLYVYDVKTNVWFNVPDKGSVPDRFDSNSACVLYDSVNDRMIDAVYAGDKRGVSVFDPEAAAWGDALLPFPTKMPGHCWHAFYSPAVNAHFFWMAGDSQDNGTMWVYRYKKADKK